MASIEEREEAEKAPKIMGEIAFGDDQRLFAFDEGDGWIGEGDFVGFAGNRVWEHNFLIVAAHEFGGSHAFIFIEDMVMEAAGEEVSGDGGDIMAAEDLVLIEAGGLGTGLGGELFAEFAFEEVVEQVVDAGGAEGAGMVEDIFALARDAAFLEAFGEFGALDGR